jgi:hypothetical protein
VPEEVPIELRGLRIARQINFFSGLVSTSFFVIVITYIRREINYDLVSRKGRAGGAEVRIPA